MKILFVEDEEDILEPTTISLEKLGFTVEVAENGKDGLYKAKVNTYSCIVLDINLPKINGYEILKKLREDGTETPVIMLTAKNGLEDKLAGFKHGSDDYITKPFDVYELAARIKAVTKRFSPNKSQRLIYGSNELIPEKNLLIRYKTNPNETASPEKHKEIVLSNKEAAILEYLIRNKGQIIASEDILEHVWDSEIDPFTDTLKTHMKTLRKKADPKKKHIQTIRGKGYVLD